MTVLVRHAESEWNHYFGSFRIDAGIPDPVLTEAGRLQAEALAADLQAEPFERILASPYRRALQTASIIAGVLRLPIEVEPLVRERCAFSCDQGSPPELLAAMWPELDFDGLERCWWGGAIESMESLRSRCGRFRAKLDSRPDRHALLIVTHWGFIRGLTGLEVGNAARVRLADAPVPA